MNDHRTQSLNLHMRRFALEILEMHSSNQAKVKVPYAFSKTKKKREKTVLV